MPTLQCLCGEIEIAVSGEPIVQLYCHCDDCQLFHGAAYAPQAVYRASDVEIVRGEPREWRLVSTPRHFCSNCTTRLFSLGAETMCVVNAYLLPPGQFRPALHIYCKFARLPIVDGLPHYATVPERWGGGEELVSWPSPGAQAAS